MAALPDAQWLAAVDFAIRQDVREMVRQDGALDINPVALSDAEITDITDFLGALTGVSADERPLGRPDEVPSGLPVD